MRNQRRTLLRWGGRLAVAAIFACMIAALVWRDYRREHLDHDLIVAIKAVNAYHFGPDRHRVLGIKARLLVSWEDGTTWEGATEYYVRRKGRGVRIVHWEAPWEEIKEARRRLLAA